MPTLVTEPDERYYENARHWQGIPGIECSGNGRLWATWYTGGEGEGAGNHVVLVTSDDDGLNWSEPVLVVEAPEGGRCFDPALWHDPKGRLWLFWAQCGGGLHYDGRAGVWATLAGESGEAACQWSKPRRLCNGIMMNKPVVLSSGEWVLPAAVWLREPHIPELDAERFSNMIVSKDEGETWSRRGGADIPDRSFDEHHIVERLDGSLWMLVRGAGIGDSVSTDRGVTWSPGRKTAIEGPNSRFFIRRLRSGRLLLVNHHGYPKDSDSGQAKRSHLKAFLSEDDGATWIGGLMVDERPGVSYPDAVERPDGRISVIYDHNRADRSSLGREGEILMATFTEKDVLAGKCVDERSQLRIRVSSLRV